MGVRTAEPAGLTVLAAEQRLSDPEGFRAASRRGRRAGTRTLVLHLLVPGDEQVVGMPARIGFVVSKAVGSAVVRNRVKRRLRHLVRVRVGALPSGATLVVRAQPPAAGASAAELGADLDRCLQRVIESAQEKR